MAIGNISTSFPTTSRGTLISTTAPTGAISTQWDFIGAGVFAVITDANTGAFGSALDSDIDFVDFWLPPFHEYSVRVRFNTGNGFGDWYPFVSVTSRPLVNSAENYNILNANTITA